MTLTLPALIALAAILVVANAGFTVDPSRVKRTYDGFGNNPAVDKQSWGTAMGPFARKMIPFTSYIDQINTVGREGNGIHATLPSARLLSNLMAEAAWDGRPKNKAYLNDMHTYWGHFITGDCVDTLRNETYVEAPRFIDIPAGDPYYPNGSSLNPMIFFRASPHPDSGITYPRIPVNTQTAYLDLSFVYPSDPATRSRITDATTGKLIDNIPSFIPPSPFFEPIYPGTWLLGGDARINKTPPLRSYWALFVKEHNRLVDLITADNPTASPSDIFEEARRWNIAFFQAISVREYLAATIGKPLPPYRDASGSEAYDPEVDATIDVMFAHCAFRYGHAKVNERFTRMDNNREEIEEGHLQMHLNVYIPKNWNTADPAGGADNFNAPCVFRGMANTLAGELDVGVVHDVRNFLLMGPRGGLDLLAYNIERGRDVGLPSYNAVREYFNMTRKDTWADVTSNTRVQKYLQQAYGGTGPADNCDPYVCGLAEDHFGSSSMGELFSYILEVQFLNMRNGDRFWFERDTEFSAEDLQVIYGTKLVDLITRNFPEVAPESLTKSSFFVDARQLNATGASADSFFYPNPADLFPEAPVDFTVIDVAPAYRLNWRMNDDDSEITFLLQTKSTGWVGLGFDPNPNTMKGADIVLCRIRPESGEGECRDSFALDVGEPILDVVLGTRSNLKDVSVVQKDGFTNALFTRPVDTGDATYDKVISDRTMRIIFAFNPLTNELQYHGPTRSAERLVNFIGDYTRPLGPPQRARIPLGLIIFAAILAGLGILYAIFVIAVIAAKTDYFKYQTPSFCYLINIGTILGYVSVLLTLPDQTLGLCAAQPWLWGVSFMLVFGSLFAKVWRVWRIAGNTKLSKAVKVTEWDVAKPVIGLVILDLIFLAIWTGVDMPKAIDLVFDNQVFKICRSEGVFWWPIFLGYKILILVFGVFLAVQSRNFDTALNESKQVALGLYVMLLDIAIMIPIGYSLMHIPLVTFIVFVFGICLPYIAVTGILFSGNILRIFTGKEPKQVKRGGTTGQTKGTAGTAKTSTGTSGGSSINETGEEELKAKPTGGKKPEGAKPAGKTGDRIPLREPPKQEAKTVSETSSSSSSEAKESPKKAQEPSGTSESPSGSASVSDSASPSGSQSSASASASGSAS